MTTLTKRQVRYARDDYTVGGKPETLIIEIRYDDRCGNGHNTFSMTAEIYRTGWAPGEQTLIHKSGWKVGLSSCGPNHEPIRHWVPELARYIKWHLCSTNGPLHYIANTRYHVRNGSLDAARRCAIWPDATDEELTAPGLEQRLKERLPALMAEFKADVESLGFTY